MTWASPHHPPLSRRSQWAVPSHRARLSQWGGICWRCRHRPTSHSSTNTLAHLSLSPSILQTTYVAQRATKHISVFNFSCLNCSTLGVDQLLCKYGMAHPPFQLLYFYRGFRSKLQGTLGSPKWGFSITIDVHVTWSCSAGTRSNCLPHL